MEDVKLVGGKKASEILGIHQRTLYQWEEKRKIETTRTPGGKRLYNVDKFLKDRGFGVMIKVADIEELESQTELNISYVRVSTHGQRDDLERQKKMIYEKYPDFKIIEDIGSGVNLNRRGLRKIIKLAIAGKVKKLVIAYKDRLTCFGYDLIEDLIKDYSGGEIIIIEQKDDLEPEEELVTDVLQMMNVFVAKMNGLRRYKKKTGEIE